MSPEFFMYLMVGIGVACAGWKRNKERSPHIAINIIAFAIHIVFWLPIIAYAIAMDL